MITIALSPQLIISSVYKVFEKYATQFGAIFDFSAPRILNKKMIFI